MDSPAFDNVPAMPPPDGVASNFTDPCSEADVTLVVGATFLVLATIAVTARLFTKLRIVKKIDIEDCTSSYCPLFMTLTKLQMFSSLLGSAKRSQPRP